MGQESFLEFRRHLFHDNEPFGRQATLTRVGGSCQDGLFGGQPHVGIVEHDEGVGPTQFKHHFLDLLPGQGTDLGARRHTAGERHTVHPVPFDELSRRPGIGQEGLKQVLGEAGFEKKPLQFQGGEGHIGGMLEQAGVARHQGRNPKAQDLPEGIIPGHDAQNDAERGERDVAS